ncbi:MAG: hypothetical protein NTV70_09555 [Acidobacteria bacterium]|nr:hypothetical protein [Acidobacteriota bacterium]
MILSLYGAANADASARVLSFCEMTATSDTTRPGTVIVLAELGKGAHSSYLWSKGCEVASVNGAAWENQVWLADSSYSPGTIGGSVDFTSDRASFEAAWAALRKVKSDRVAILLEGVFRLPKGVTVLKDGTRIGVGDQGLYYSVFVAKRILAVLPL